MKIYGYKCKFCDSDDLAMIETDAFVDDKENEKYYYIYHYSLDYELGCRQRIGLEDIHNNLVRK